MSNSREPTRSEVEKWSPQQLAEYLNKINMGGCDKVVMKNSISGSRFVNLSENDLQKFPMIHIPLISKISSEISKRKKEKPGLMGRLINHLHEPEPYPDGPGGWNESDFDSDGDLDDDYESPYSGEEGGGGDDNGSTNEDYEPPPTEPPDDLPHPMGPTLSIGGDDLYIDRNNHAPPPTVFPRPPVPSPSPRMPGELYRRDPSPSPHGGGRPSGNFPSEPPRVCREDKPRLPTSTPPPYKGLHPSSANLPSAHSRRSQPDTLDPPSWPKTPAVPPSSSISRSNSSARPPPHRFDGSKEHPNDEVLKRSTFPLQNKSLPPRPGLPDTPSRQAESLPPHIPSTGSLPQKLSSGSFSRLDRPALRPPQPTSTRTQGLDPRWYVGKVTRGQAEGCLQRVNKDGSYLVRDSTRQQANQPFTLMVFYQDKVFNIQIRQENQQFLLGTGLKLQESFPSVNSIISHYSQSPLLLINTKNPNSSQQNQCLLSDPAGFYMSRQNWS